MADGDLRLFAAIGLPEAAREELRRVGEAMRTFAPDGTRWMDVAGAHLTLQFIGNRPADGRRDDRRRAHAGVVEARDVRAIAGGRRRLPVAGRAACALGRRRRRPRCADVATARRFGCARGDGLRQAGAVVQPAPDGVQDSSGGIVGRARRIRRAASRRRRRGRDPPCSLAVKDVGLYRSELLPTGARYTRLVNAPLAG